MIQKAALSWATVNTADEREMAGFRHQRERAADGHAKAAYERLKPLGVVDENGESIGGELPPDMQPGAKRDFWRLIDRSRATPSDSECGPE